MLFCLLQGRLIFPFGKQVSKGRVCSETRRQSLGVDASSADAHPLKALDEGDARMYLHLYEMQ